MLVQPLSVSVLIASVFSLICLAPAGATPAEESPAAGNLTPAPYSDDVVAKADAILAAAGLKRSGKTLVASGAGELNRVLSNLAKSRRALKQLGDVRQQSEEQLALLHQQFQMLDAQNGELNLRLARPLPDAKTNNQLVGMINANNVRLRQLDQFRSQLREKLAVDRKRLNDAEAEYSETVLALRRDFSTLHASLESALQDDKLQIALKVSHVNFQTPETLDMAMLLGSTDRRIKQLEQEIFSESVPIDVSPSGALYVQVVVGGQNTAMVLDSGASLVSLPAETAAQLGITVPPGAPRMQLVLADGRTMSAHSVILPSVRVGQFEAHDVEAAVLDPVAINAEPLLGMSFLGNFRFEIDAASRSLKMLRVGEQP